MLRIVEFKILLVVVFASTVVLFNTNSKSSSDVYRPKDTLFEKHVLDLRGPVGSWGKTFGDINGDGLLDVIVGGHSPDKLGIMQRVERKLGILAAETSSGSLVWYENPSWKKHVVTHGYAIRTGISVSDVDNDGKNDFVLLTDSGLVWLKNPTWATTQISQQIYHDVEVADLNRDGRKDIIVRNQSLFNYKNGNIIRVFYQQPDNQWLEKHYPVPHGEGLAVADLNRDGWLDIVVNSIWLENPGAVTAEEWLSHFFTHNWTWNDVKVQVADINEDNRPDIVMTPAEKAGGRYRVSWFEGPETMSANWVEHVIKADVESALHSLAVKDFDGDGSPDVLVAEMSQSEDHGRITLYKNLNKGQGWQPQVLATGGLHNLVAEDIDGDYDIDFMGTNWRSDDGKNVFPVQLWLNRSNNTPWKKIIIDTAMASTALFIYTVDVDNDGDVDILTGDSLYRNTGAPDFNYNKEKIGKNANNVVMVYDFNRDGAPDVLASKWKGLYYQSGYCFRVRNKLGLVNQKDNTNGNEFVLAINNGKGEFNIFDNIPAASGDFLQGADLINNGGQISVVLSWHKAGYGIQSFGVPDHPLKDKWVWKKESDFSQDEDLSVADIDGDQKKDILMGTKWLQRHDSGWQLHTLYNTKGNPDRNLLIDLNQDKKLDAVVGYEAISKSGVVAWYEQGKDVDAIWKEHVIANIIGPMSLGAGDIDLDGDKDLVVGEHNIKHPELARLFVFYNNLAEHKKWGVKVIGEGEEHHMGAKVVDYDQDGDLDVLSIGWSHDNLYLYVNPGSQRIE